MDTLKPRLESELAAIREAGLTKDERVLVSPQGATVRLADGREVLVFCANNYLGLSSHPEVIAAAHRALDSHGYGLSSVPRNSAIRCSRVLCRSWVPQMKRTLDRP